MWDSLSSSLQSLYSPLSPVRPWVSSEGPGQEKGGGPKEQDQEVGARHGGHSQEDPGEEPERTVRQARTKLLDH